MAPGVELGFWDFCGVWSFQGWERKRKSFTIFYYSSVNLIPVTRKGLIRRKNNRVESQRRMSYCCISTPTCKTVPLIQIQKLTMQVKQTCIYSSSLC